MFSFAGLQVHRYKQRVLTRRAHATATTDVNLPNFNDWHLVKVWVGGAGGRGSQGIPGSSWSRIQCDGYVYPGTIRDIAQSTRHVFWMAIDNTLYRSIDGGGTWTLEPDGKKVFPVNTRLNSLLPCVGDANKVFGFGADGGSGFIFNGYA